MKAPWTRAFCGFLLATSLLLGGARPPATAAPAGPHVEIHTLEPAPVRGVLAGLTADGASIQAAGAAEPTLHGLGTIRELRFVEARIHKADGVRFRAYLTGGDLLIGALKGPSETGVVLAVAGLGDVDVSFDVLRTLEWMPVDAGACHDLADRHPRAKAGDIAYDARGDEYRGTVLEATAEKVVIESSRGRKRAVAWKNLRVLHLENDRLPPAKGLEGEVELASGTRIAVEQPVQLTPKGIEVRGRSTPNSTWTIALDAVRSMRWWGGTFVYASGLPFKSERKPYYTDPEGLMDKPYLERFFGTRVDRRASGCPLRLGGARYRRGFGVNSHSRIEIALAGAFTSFRAGFGIDDEVMLETGDAGRRGNVDARVLGDGKVLWEGKDVEGGAKPRRVGPLDVSGVKTLVLEVGFGKDFTTLDRADWVDPILVRK